MFVMIGADERYYTRQKPVSPEPVAATLVILGEDEVSLYAIVIVAGLAAIAEILHRWGRQ
jgi:hypothetical protein